MGTMPEINQCFLILSLSRSMWIRERAMSLVDVDLLVVSGKVVHCWM